MAVRPNGIQWGDNKPIVQKKKPQNGEETKQKTKKQITKANGENQKTKKREKKEGSNAQIKTREKPKD
jgi:hypothetical protein